MATLVTRSGKGSPLTHAEVDANFTNLNTDKLELSGGTMTGNLSFGDNDKAIFGAGSDLQIYHDGSGSFVDDQGTGGLILRGTNLFLRSSTNENYLGAVADGAVTIYHDNAQKLVTTSTGISVTGNATFADNGKAIFGAGSDLQIYHETSTGNSRIVESGSGHLNIEASNLNLKTPSGENYINCNDNGNVLLRYDNAQKLATTSTGIDVTGSISADGLSVDLGNTTDVDVNGTDGGGIQFSYNGVHQVRIDSANNDGGLYHAPTGKNHTFRTDGKNRLKIGDNGDISFYEDTGTTAKFFWDASAESLGIGTTSPAGGIDATTASSDAYFFKGSHATTTNFYITNTNATSGNTANLYLAPANGVAGSYISSIAIEDFSVSANRTADLAFYTRKDGTFGERMRIDSSGNVGIGTTSPSAPLHVNGGSSGGFATVKHLELGYTASRGLTISTSQVVAVDDLVTFDAPTATYGQMAFKTAGSERMRIDSSGNVGIGTSAPSTRLDVSTSTSTIATFRVPSGGGANNKRLEVGTGGDRVIFKAYTDSDSSAAAIAFNNGATSEAMRIDSSGNLLVGTTSTPSTLLTATSGGGMAFDGTNDYLVVAREGAGGGYPVLRLNQTGVDGEIIEFRKDGTAVGSIGTAGSRIFIGSSDTTIRFKYGLDGVVPANGSGALRDNQMDLGQLASRWDDVYATNGTIQTSDRNEKQDIAELSDAEQRVAVAAKGLMRKFRWKDKVAEKGDEARTHFGIIAQDLQAAFAAEGLDAGDYAMFIHTTWTDEETGEERSRMGVRYSELLAFIIAAI